MSVWRDARLRLVVGLSVIMALVLVVMLSQASSESRIPLAIGFALIMALIQTTFLLRGRSLQSLLVKAQAAFVEGRYDEAAQLLESQLEQNRADEKTPDFKTLTVLGNTYRQLSRLEESAALLQQTVEQFPGRDFPVYGLGRTRLAQGQYSEAVRLIEQALRMGARRAILADLVLALHYAGADQSRIIEVAHQAGRVLNLESYRVLMVNYILHTVARHDSREVQLARRVMHHHAAGLAYWQGEAKRHSSTDFGQRLISDVAHLEAILAEETSGHDPTT